MSREIKFRIWDKANKEYKILGATGLDARNGDVIDYYNEGNRLGGPEEYNIEQYTGLKDKNGKEIYEGDIIESTWNGDKAEVVWNDVEGEWEHYADFNTHSKYSGSVVIGNIHENPELLGGEE